MELVGEFPRLVIAQSGVLPLIVAQLHDVIELLEFIGENRMLVKYKTP
jgi:sorbitol-specific phosphotransferase system component IIC